MKYSATEDADVETRAQALKYAVESVGRRTDLSTADIIRRAEAFALYISRGSMVENLDREVGNREPRTS